MYHLHLRLPASKWLELRSRLSEHLHAAGGPVLESHSLAEFLQKAEPEDLLITSPLSGREVEALKCTRPECQWWVYAPLPSPEEVLDQLVLGARGVLCSLDALENLIETSDQPEEWASPTSESIQQMAALFDAPVPEQDEAWQVHLSRLARVLDVDFVALLADESVLCQFRGAEGAHETLANVRVELSPSSNAQPVRLVVGHVHYLPERERNTRALLPLAARFQVQHIHRDWLLRRVLKAKQEWEATADAIPDPLFLADESGKILRGNNAFARLIGTSVQGLVGQFLQPSIGIGLDVLSSLADRQGGEGTESMVTLPISADRRFQVHRYQLEDVRGELLFYLRDITEERRLFSIVVNQERYAALGEFSEMLFHDLKSPATNLGTELYNVGSILPGLLKFFEKVTLKGADAAWLKSELLSLQESIEGANKSVEHLNQMLDTLTQYRRLGVRQGLETSTEPSEVYREEIQLQIILQTLSRLYKSVADRNRVRIRLELESLPGVVGHGNEILRVFDNLVKNALEAQPDGGEILIRAREVGPWVKVEIVDKGGGIPPHIIPHIFERGFTTRLAVGGTGIGLFLCRQIVNAHRGTIEVQSTENVGTCFTVSLPVS